MFSNGNSFMPTSIAHLFLFFRKVDDVKISFDVHLPNAKFKKTQPGLPNHRVCVVRQAVLLNSNIVLKF